MKIMFPIGTKTKCFVDKINITAQLQCVIDKEINSFYHHIPLKKEPFDYVKDEKYVKHEKHEKHEKQKKRINITKKLKK
jgi:hypothetical protein